MTLVIKLRSNAQNPCIRVAIAQQILIGHIVMYQGKYLQCKMPIEHRGLFTIYPEKKYCKNLLEVLKRRQIRSRKCHD